MGNIHELTKLSLVVTEVDQHQKFNASDFHVFLVSSRPLLFAFAILILDTHIIASLVQIVGWESRI